MLYILERTKYRKFNNKIVMVITFFTFSCQVKTAEVWGWLKREINCADVSLASKIKGYFWYFLIEVEAAFFFFFFIKNHGRCGSRHVAGVAADGAGGWEGYAADSTGTALHAAPHVRQRGSLLWNVSTPALPLCSGVFPFLQPNAIVNIPRNLQPQKWFYRLNFSLDHWNQMFLLNVKYPCLIKNIVLFGWYVVPVVTQELTATLDTFL